MSVLAYVTPRLSLGAHEVDVLPRRQAHIGLLPRSPRAGALAEALLLGRNSHDRHSLDLDLEQELDGPANVRLGRVGTHLEDDLVAGLGDARRLLGHVRAEQHLHQPFTIGTRAHRTRSSTIFNAAAVTTIFSAPTRLTGSMSCASSTATFGKLRAASQSFMSNASTIMRPLVNPSCSSLPRSSFVFVADSVSSGVTTSRSWRTSSD